MSGKMKKALVIDDNQEFAESFVALLKKEGIDASTFEDFSQFLTHLTQEPYDTVFIDCVLASQDGVTVAKKIQKHLNQFVRIIFISGIIHEKNLEGTINYDGFLKKPIDMMQFHKLLKNIDGKGDAETQGSFLKILFTKNFDTKSKLKLLVNKDQMNVLEFLFSISSLLKTSEYGLIKFSLNNEIEKIFFKDNKIIDYKLSKESHFLNFLIHEKKILSESESKEFQISDDIFKDLTNQCIISPHQARQFKLEKLFFDISKLTGKFFVELELFKPGEDNLNLHSKEFSQKSMEVLENLKLEDYEKIFGSHFLNSHFFFQEKDEEKQSPEDSFKKGGSLQNVYERFEKNKLLFFQTMLRYLMNGNLVLEDSGKSSSGRNLLKQRYEYIYKKIEFSTPEDTFKLLIDPEYIGIIHKELVVKTYKNFVKYNHPDTLPKDSGNEVKDIIGKVLNKLKQDHDKIVDPVLRIQEEKKQKEESVKQAIQKEQEFQAIHEFLAKGMYDKAFTLFKKISMEEVERDIKYKLIYLWIYLKQPKCGISLSPADQFLKDILLKQNSQSAGEDPIFCYVVGLHYKSQKNYIRAKECFERAKALAPSLTPIYHDLKDVLLYSKKTQKVKLGGISNIKDQLSGELKKFLKKSS